MSPIGAADCASAAKTQPHGRMKLNASDYADTFGVSSDTAYDQLKSASDDLFNRYIRIMVKTPKGMKERKFRWVSGVEYHHGEGWVELNFTPEIAPHVLALRTNFTTYKLKQAAAYRSIFTWRMMEVFNSWTDKKKHPDGVLHGCYSPKGGNAHIAEISATWWICCANQLQNYLIE